MKVKAPISTQQTSCYHCGDRCSNVQYAIGEKYFCCHGCQSVFEILNENDLCDYYAFNQRPGIEQKSAIRKDKFAFLDNADIKKKLIQFSDGTQTHITFYLPQIHCSSCLWLLENVHAVEAGIVNATVNFTKKELFIVFEEDKTSLRKVVETLTKIGYEPHLSLAETTDKDIRSIDRTRWYKIGVAGFCFGNIMMLSFADYLSISNALAINIRLFFQTMSIVLALPVLLFAASEFFVSAWNGLKSKYLNIDFPIALALVITFSRSIYEIVSGTGNGYLDSMSGIVFFMLIGRWLQSRTYQTISFDRDYKSFFPIALQVITNGKVIPTEISKVKKNDIIQIYSNEIIPVDAIVSKGNAKIDYSFVSGESLPIHLQKGELVYAGGKQLDGLLELVVIKEVSQSYLTNLWNNSIFHKKVEKKSNGYDAIAKYFTYVVLVFGFGAGFYWLHEGKLPLMWNAITTVLIVACPCALLLSQNYTNGNLLRIFGLNKFYLRSADIIDKMAAINHIVLDKTGTITQAHANNIHYQGNILTDEYKLMVAALAKQSSHPASKIVYDFLSPTNAYFNIDNYTEKEGLGIEGWIEEHHVKLGSPLFIGGEYKPGGDGTKVVVYMDGNIIGEFIITNKYRFGVTALIATLRKSYALSLLSGDNDAELQHVQTLLGRENQVLFNQSPQQKLEYIAHLQNTSQASVMMVGDGLNDAGALKQSDVGIAVADTKNSFAPSSDGVIDATKLTQLDAFIKLAKAGKKIILFSFAVSVTYNAIGLYYAVQGTLSPVIAAILMPCSSISIILLTYGLSEWLAFKYKLNQHQF